MRVAVGISGVFVLWLGACAPTVPGGPFDGGGPPPDAAARADAGEVVDARVEPDAGVPAPDAGSVDPGAPPLRVHPDNPIWLDDGTGRGVVLVGASHGWELADDGWEVNGTLDWDAWLENLAGDQLNYARLWRVESPQQTETDTGLATPMPYVRGDDGRFDLDRFEPAYFARLRERAERAGERGIYVSVMFFERHSTFREGEVYPWAAHPFAAGANTNGVDADGDGDGQGREYFRLPSEGGDADVLARQEAYVREVVETLNDLDNVVYEICNECTPDAHAWQEHLIAFARAHEATLPQQHLIGYTGPGRADDGSFPDFERQLASDADFVSPRDASAYRTNPPANDGRKVIFADSDHIDPFGRDELWVWRSFLRGLHPQVLERFPGDPEAPPGTSDARDRGVRRAMRWVAELSTLVDLATLRPSNALASSRYALASPGDDYVVFAPEGGPITVDLSAAEGALHVIWLDVRADTTHPASALGGASRTLTPPFSGPAVAWLHATGEPAPLPSCADVPGGVAHIASRFVPSEATPSREFSIPVPGGVSFSRIEVDLDVTHGGWYAPAPDGTHAIFQLTRGRWRSNLYGFVTAFGPPQDEVKVISNIDLPAGEVLRLNRRPARLEPGETYHVRYVYDAAGGERRLTVTHGADVVVDIADANVAPTVTTTGSLDVILATPLNPEGPEVPSYGWVYDGFCLRVFP